jgi:pyruvyltransferase
MTIHAVRGPLTRAKLGKVDLPIGDPAMLLPLIWPKGRARSAIAVVTHYRSCGPFVRRYAAELPRHWHVVNALDERCKIIEKISGSDFVAFSSLHGLVVADAYGIPNCWIESEEPLIGDRFKFDDYAAPAEKSSTDVSRVNIP